MALQPKPKIMMRQGSWGNYFNYAPQNLITPHWRDTIDLATAGGLLAYGNGRSYGDSCLLDKGTLIVTARLNRFIAFDKQAGIIRCEAGICLADILQVVTPAGWTLPVVPGTRFVTLGGAIANDIHGKNHPMAGTFGCHINQFELLRSNGEHLLCSAQQNKALYKATIGGLGLTGLITWAELRLKPIPGPFLMVETLRFRSLTEFFELYEPSKISYEYNVAWLDCQSNPKKAGQGIFLRANYTQASTAYQPKQSYTVPFHLPNCTLNNISIGWFNRLYYHRSKPKQRLVHYLDFFFPLDDILHWNRIYGKRGFFQYQCVLPTQNEQGSSKALLTAILHANQTPFLSVIKGFGEHTSPGMLSFPRPGITFALDFANQGQTTLALFNRLDDIVLQFGGCIYPAKDARMSTQTFRQAYPQWQSFSKHIDPRFCSNFWQRVNKG